MFDRHFHRHCLAAVLISGAFLLGCQPTDEPELENGVPAPDAVSTLGESSGDLTLSERREQALETMRTHLTEVKQQIHELEVDAESLSQQAREKFATELAKVRQQQSELETQIEKLKVSSEENVDDMVQATRASYMRVHAAITQALDDLQAEKS